jgi:hypothetical protein
LRLPSVFLLSAELEGCQFLNICRFVQDSYGTASSDSILHVQSLKARAIYTELESVYGPEALPLPTVKKWRRRFHHGRLNLFDDPRSGRPLMNGLAGVIGSMLEERPFSSWKVPCCHFPIGKTCLRIHHDKLGLKKFHLSWVSHASVFQPARRIAVSD